MPASAGNSTAAWRRARRAAFWLSCCESPTRAHEWLRVLNMSRIWALRSGLGSTGSMSSFIATPNPVARFAPRAIRDTPHTALAPSEERRLAPARWRSRLGLGITSPLLDGGSDQPADAVRRRGVARVPPDQ